MASQLTNLEKLKILGQLGWPAKTTDPTSLSFSNIVSDKLTDLPDEMLSEARRYLTRFDNLETKLDKALGRAGVKSIDDITLNSENEMDILRREKRKLVRELSVLLDIAMITNSGGMGSVII
jgi:hypothetical protein